MRFNAFSPLFSAHIPFFNHRLILLSPYLVRAEKYFSTEVDSLLTISDSQHSDSLLYTLYMLSVGLLLLHTLIVICYVVVYGVFADIDSLCPIVSYTLTSSDQYDRL
jgi:hypothetical protein